MFPIICQVGPVSVYSYGLMLVIAFFVSSFLASQEAKKRGMQEGIIFNLLFTAFIWGVIGARAFYVIENLDFYRHDLIEIIKLQHGGLSWYGGLILGAGSGAIYLKKKKQPLYKVLDLIIPFVALGQAIGRIGCLLNGCCYGRESQFGIYFPAHDSVLIPTQIYSSLTLVIIFVILRFLQAKPHSEGEIFFTYLLLYSIKRFLVEFSRADNPIIFYKFTLFQIISFAFFCLSVIRLLRIKSR
ncbi:MAG: prolipoprotein diacylglyceryl transferase [Candidatus Omnitrophota bacterium]